MNKKKGKTNPSWNIVTSVDLMGEFIDANRSIAGMYVAAVDANKCKTLDSMYTEFARAFEFPDYFGYNWAAFDECMNDLDWLQFDAVTLSIMHCENILSKDSDRNRKLLFEYLEETRIEWVHGRNHNKCFPTPPTPYQIFLQSEDVEKVKYYLESNGISDYDILK